MTKETLEEEDTGEKLSLLEGPKGLLVGPVVVYMTLLPLAFFASLRVYLGVFFALLSAGPLVAGVWRWCQESPGEGEFRSESTQSFVMSCASASFLMLAIGLLLFLKPAILS